jgi:arsenite-transporting ATPase
MFFSMYGLTVDAVIVNRLLPPDLQDSFFTGWKHTQDRHLASIDEFFAPVPIWRVPLFDNEILGFRELDRLGKSIYGLRDPAQVFYRESPYRFKQTDGAYQMRMRLPFATVEDVELFKHGDELVVRVGNFKRHLALPRRMAHLEPNGSRVENGELVISFVKEEPASSPRAIATQRK